MAPRETENNAYAKFCGDKQRALWYVIVFSGVVNSGDGDDRRIFGGLKVSILGLFWVGNFDKYLFCVARVKEGFFVGYSKQSKGSW